MPRYYFVEDILGDLYIVPEERDFQSGPRNTPTRRLDYPDAIDTTASESLGLPPPA